MSLSRQICCAFISEYKTYRMAFLWNSIVQKVLANFTSFYSDRIKECDDLIRQINSATTVAEKTEIIDLLGKMARKAQEQKKAAETWKIPDWILNKFRKASSLWAKTLHAVRTCLIADILNSTKEDKEAFFNEIATLKVEYYAYHEPIQKGLTKTISVKELKEKRKEIYWQLLDRQDQEMILDAAEFDRFPLFTPSQEDLKLSDEIKVSEDYPAVYNDNYFTIFFLSELHVKSGREVKFNELLKKYQERSKHSDLKQISLLDDGFFNSTDFKEFLQANTPQIKGQTATPLATTEKAKDQTENVKKEPNEKELAEKQNNNTSLATDSTAKKENEAKDTNNKKESIDTGQSVERPIKPTTSVTAVSMYKQNKKESANNTSSSTALLSEFESPEP